MWGAGRGRRVCGVSTAEQILVVYGILIIGYGFVLGIPIARARSAAPEASRHLVNRHVASIMQGPIHLGLAYAFAASGFDSWMATTAAVLVVAGSAAETLGGTANWLAGTGDQFAEKSLGYWLSAASGPPAIAGIAIAAVGVLSEM